MCCSAKLPILSLLLWQCQDSPSCGCKHLFHLQLQTNHDVGAAGYVKYGYPIAAATTMLAWGLIEFPTVSAWLQAICDFAQTFIVCQ